MRYKIEKLGGLWILTISSSDGVVMYEWCYHNVRAMQWELRHCPIL